MARFLSGTVVTGTARALCSVLLEDFKLVLKVSSWNDPGILPILWKMYLTSNLLRKGVLLAQECEA